MTPSKVRGPCCAARCSVEAVPVAGLPTGTATRRLQIGGIVPRRTETWRRKQAKRKRTRPELQKPGLALVRPETRERAGKAGPR
jgi:hypothetical protein